MSKKNLGRTPLEGGRVKACRIQEWEGKVSERVAYNQWCNQARIDPEMDEPGEEFRVPWIDLDFADRLNPLRRWINAQVGRPWDDIYGEICSKFDKRSLAGRHILGHLMNYVTLPSDKYPSIFEIWKGELYVDEMGVLRKARQRMRAWWR